MKIKFKILCLVLVVMLCPIMMLFTGCKKDEGYKLSSLEGDFRSITVGLSNVKVKNNKFIFDYSEYKKDGEEYIENLIRTEQPYNNLISFNTLVDNLLGFTYEYIDECSVDSIEVGEEFRNSLKKQLEDLKSSFKEVDTYTNQWAETLYRVDKSEKTSLYMFEILLKGYNNLYQKAINFANSISYLYYNHALSNSNPKISSAAQCLDVITKVKGRVKYQTSCLTQSYVEMYLDGGNLIKEIVDKKNGYKSIDLNQGNYLQKINALNVNFDITKASEKAINADKAFYELAVKAYNLQNVLANNFKSFEIACNKINYVDCKELKVLNAEQIMYVQIIEDNFEYLTIYNNTLQLILEIIK